ncbi:hypothetical protein WA538_005568, partial [Blastocystis sp. DL]
MSVRVKEMDEDMTKPLPHGVDMYKEDLDGPLWWLQDNDYLYRGYRTQLSFWETFKSAFRSTNETMNIWTHYIGAAIFIFLIYLTYAIPVENMFTLRQDVVMANAVAQCSSRNFTDIVRENESVNATCVDVLSRDESVAEDFSALFYYLSTPKTKESISNVSDASTSFFSWYGSNGVASLSSNSVTSVMTALRSLYQYLLTWIQSNPNDADLPDVQKSVEITENLRSDLAELNHQVVGHVPRWPIIVFIACAIWCMGGSAIYHQYYCTSFIVSNVLQTIDYCGICILISGSYVPVIYYTFYCYPKALWIHLGIVIFINVCNVCVMATPKFRQPKYRPIRARCFTIVACYAVFLLIHIYILDGFNNPIFTVMFWYIVGMGSTYILGAVFYGTRIPEKYFPGYFDYVFASHQLFHVCIVIAALFHYVGSYQIFVDRFSHPCMAH